MGKYVGNWDKWKYVGNDEKYDGVCEECCDAGRGNIYQYVDILQGVAQGCTLSRNLFKVYIDDMIVAVEAAKQGVTMEEDTVSGFMYADDFVGNHKHQKDCRNR